jgi:hypothetical protein
LKFLTSGMAVKLDDFPNFYCSGQEKAMKVICNEFLGAKNNLRFEKSFDNHLATIQANIKM